MMRKWELSLRIAAAAALIMALAACGGNGNKNAAQSPSPGTAASPAAGGGTATANAEALYKQNCVACHGANLDGNGAANKNLTKVGAKYTKEQILGIVTNGRNGMPAFKGKLKDEELNALSDWLAAKK